MVSAEQWERFERDLELDLAYDVPGLSRFRVNLFQQRNAYGVGHAGHPARHQAAATNSASPSRSSRFAHLPRGLVLVTGPTGSGKTTTLASLLDLANRTRHDHIVTIEDPIEFLHKHKRCLVNQREVGVDTEGFATALKHVLRQDPDIILVGELRDLETVSTAITAAETGHLVLATLHTQSAAQTIDRVIDIFPPHQQQEIRAQLSTALQGIVTQALVPRRGRHRPHGRLRGHVRHPGDPQPDPRGQEPPDPVVHAVLRRRRHADLRPAPGAAGHRSSHHATTRLSTCATRSSRNSRRLAGRGDDHERAR